MPSGTGAVSRSPSTIALVTPAAVTGAANPTKEANRTPVAARPLFTPLPTVLQQGLSEPQYTYRIINRFPHDDQAFTQGLVYENGRLYESTGRRGQSTLREVDLETGVVHHMRAILPDYFGEGIAIVNERVMMLTWQAHIGLVYDKHSFDRLGTFNYPNEGWGLAYDGESLIMSDGSALLRFLDPQDFTEIRRIEVLDNGTPVIMLNELEYVQGEIFANVWKSNRIARIDPQTGEVTAWIDMNGLLDYDELDNPVDVLNGIAYDLSSDYLLVTGKLWPYLFEVDIVPY